MSLPLTLTYHNVSKLRAFKVDLPAISALSHGWSFGIIFTRISRSESVDCDSLAADLDLLHVPRLHHVTLATINVRVV